jgi:hypothetical protein
MFGKKCERRLIRFKASRRFMHEYHLLRMVQYDLAIVDIRHEFEIAEIIAYGDQFPVVHHGDRIPEYKVSMAKNDEDTWEIEFVPVGDTTAPALRKTIVLESEKDPRPAAITISFN